MLAKKLGRTFPLGRRQLIFALLLCLVLTVDAVPSLRASALYLLSDGTQTVPVEDGTEVTDDRVIVTGGKTVALSLEGGHKVTVTHGGETAYATTRSGESIPALLRRMGLTVGETELVLVDVSGQELRIEIAASFTYYETCVEAAAHATVYTENYTLPKGEVQVWQQGMDGTREVVYEVTYADGERVSRQAVSESGNTSVTEYAYVGTLVREAQAGDTIASVVQNADGSGYLLMTSGDALHFTAALEVQCTAYTTGHDGVGTVTATGTTARRGCVAVDKRVIPLGSSLFITTASGSYTYGMASAEDTGVRGAKIDLYMDSYDECIQFGRRKSVAYLLG